MDTNVDPDIATLLDAESREEQFKEHVSFLAWEKRVRRVAGKAGWCAAGGLLIANVVLGGALYREITKPQPEGQILVDDKSTGWVGTPVSMTKAPAVFDKTEAAHYLRQYIEAYDCYSPDKDRLQFETVRIMSDQSQLDRYTSWRSSSEGPVKSLATNGHVDCFNYNFAAQPIKLGENRWDYVVRFESRTIKSGMIGVTTENQRTIDFGWHPDMKMNDEERSINGPGMQVFQYQRDH